MLQNTSPHFDEENRAAQFASDKTLFYRLDVCQECSSTVKRFVARPEGEQSNVRSFPE